MIHIKNNKPNYIIMRYLIFVLLFAINIFCIAQTNYKSNNKIQTHQILNDKYIVCIQNIDNLLNFYLLEIFKEIDSSKNYMFIEIENFYIKVNYLLFLRSSNELAQCCELHDRSKILNTFNPNIIKLTDSIYMKLFNEFFGYNEELKYHQFFRKNCLKFKFDCFNIIVSKVAIDVCQCSPLMLSDVNFNEFLTPKKLNKVIRMTKKEKKMFEINFNKIINNSVINQTLPLSNH